MTYRADLVQIGKQADKEVADLRSLLAERETQLAAMREAAESCALENKGLRNHVTDLEVEIADLKERLEDCGGPTLPEFPIAPAQSLRDAFLVNTKFRYGNSWYAGNAPVVVNLMKQLGVGGFRERYVPTSRPQQAAIPFLKAAGMRMHATLGVFGQNNDIVPLANGVKADPSFFMAVAGFNEPNNTPRPADWLKQTRNWQKEIWDALGGLVDVCGPAFKDNEPTMPKDYADAAAGDIGLFMDHPVFHRYPRGDVPTNGLYERRDMAMAMADGKPPDCTEGGYNTSPPGTPGGNAVTEAEQAIYAPRHLLEMVTAGVKRFSVYELIDQQTGGSWEQNWGLIRATSNDPAKWVPKPAFAAMVDLMGVVSDPGPMHTPDPLHLTVDGDVKSLAFGKRDGSAVLILWRDIKASDKTVVQVTVTTPQEVRTIPVGNTWRSLVVRDAA